MVAAEGPPPLHFVSGNLNHMGAVVESRQLYKVSCPDSHYVTTHLIHPELPRFVLNGSMIGQMNGLLMNQSLPLHLPNSSPKADSLVKESPDAPSHRYAIATPNVASGLSPKQFYILDHYGDATRFIDPFSLIPNPIILPKASFEACDACNEKFEVEKVSTGNFIGQEKLDEHNVLGVESEMHEDTEEINALLYSDDSDEDFSDSDDEVASTGHSPLKIGEYDDEYEQISEVASFDASKKRQKLLDGSYKQSSLADTASSMKLAGSSKYIGDLESGCAPGTFLSGHMDSVLSFQEKKVRIRESLNIFEKIVPGLKGKDPLLIIDGAIDYLKSLRLKAESLGVFYPQVQTTHSKWHFATRGPH